MQTQSKRKQGMSSSCITVFILRDVDFKLRDRPTLQGWLVIKFYFIY